jgi:predicted AAA+ superfamily ATPase
MSFYERQWSTGEVSLNELVLRKAPYSKEVFSDLRDLAEKIVIGGWPALIGSTVKEASQYVNDYMTLTAEVDVNKVSDSKRDPQRLKKFIQSYARNIST